ncbi:hypothetical protein SEA_TIPSYTHETREX_20 [Mycobacterium phage TipsytheTRex]|nr:hypothetical protein SEA_TIPSYTHETREX_20 [Mycobacterium phage TipsytheTRex]
MATVYAKANRTAARHVDTRKAVRDYRDGVTRRANRNLDAANKTSRITDDGYFPATITEDEEIVDDHEHCFTILNAPNAFALEFGHNPSGAFGPGGRFEGRQKKPTPPEYILTRAAIGGTVS